MKRIVVITLLWIIAAFAFWPAGGVKVVQTPNSIQNPQMVYLNDGSVIISWEERFSGRPHIMCQKLDTTGAIHWPASGVRVCMNDSIQKDHHMVTDGQDVWFVWQDTRNEGYLGGDIYAQKLSGSTGLRLWGEEGKAVCVKAEQQRLQTCAVFSTGSFVATWDDYSVDPRDIAAQWFNNDGQAQWEPEGIYIPRGMGGGYTPVALPSDESMLDVWIGRRTGDTVSAYFAQRIDSAGNFLWDTLGVLIEHALGFNGVCEDKMGGAIVLFEDLEHLAVQHVDSAGNNVWLSGGVTVVTYPFKTLHVQSPVINGLVSDGGGGCFVWSSVSVQHVNSAGKLVWNSNGVNCWIKDASASIPVAPTEIASDGNNGLFVVFDNLGWNSPDWPPDVDQGIFVQRVNDIGQIIFDTNGVMIRKWNPDSLLSSIEYTAASIPAGIISVWGDNRYQPQYALYAQIVDTTGKVGSGISEEQAPSVLKPNLDITGTVHSDRISLRYTLPVGVSGTFKMFDVAGSLICSQELIRPEGVIKWDVSSIPSGVYFAQLETTNSKVSRKLLILR